MKAPPPTDRTAARAGLVALSEAMALEGRALLTRVLPAPPDVFTQWQHYPPGDAVDPASGARWYYHAHPPEQRGEREHGHFHLFLPRTAFAGAEPLATPAKPDAAETVHVAALAFDLDGLPTHWLATNHWVTDDWFYPAEVIVARLDLLDLSDAGAGHVGRWLTLAVQACRDQVATLLYDRDRAMVGVDLRDKGVEVLASRAFAP
jgi:hypothetical protein